MDMHELGGIGTLEFDRVFRDHPSFAQAKLRMCIRVFKLMELHPLQRNHRRMEQKYIRITFSQVQIRSHFKSRTITLQGEKKIKK